MIDASLRCDIQRATVTAAPGEYWPYTHRHSLLAGLHLRLEAVSFLI